MPDYGGPGGFGPGTTGGGEAATGGMGPGQGSGYGGGNGMSQATKDRLADMARTDITNTDVEVEKTRLAADRFAQRMQQEADVNNPINNEIKRIVAVINLKIEFIRPGILDISKLKLFMTTLLLCFK